jgi:Protein of unknown function (DUF2637)
MNDKTLNRHTTITVMLVAAFAAVVSYTHIRDLAMSNGYDAFTASILPLSVDGLIVGTSFMLVSASRAALRASVARCGLWLGIVATIGANVAYGLPHGFVGSTVSAWPAVAFIVAVEAWMQLTKRKKNIKKNTAEVKPTQRRTSRGKPKKTSNINKETQQERALGEGGSTEHRAKAKRGVKPTANIIGENEGVPVFDGIPSANQVATAIRCGHAKSVQLRQIMIDDNVDLHAAMNIRATRKENSYV